jgi:hypothetical protein
MNRTADLSVGSADHAPIQAAASTRAFIVGVRIRGSKQSAREAGTRDTTHVSALLQDTSVAIVCRPATDLATAGRLDLTSLSDTSETDNKAWCVCIL